MISSSGLHACHFENRQLLPITTLGLTSLTATPLSHQLLDRKKHTRPAILETDGDVEVRVVSYVLLTGIQHI